MAASSADMELTDKEKKEFEASKGRLFKATIAVNVVYGVIALVILFAIFLSQRAREVLTESFAPFTITFVVGMLLIIIWLIVVVKDFAPTKYSTMEQDALLCPDYFVLEKTPANVLSAIPAQYKPLAQYRCVPRSDVFGTTLSTTPPAFASNQTLAKVMTPFNAGANRAATTKFSCANVYPAYLHTQDIKNPNNPNKLRCEFVKGTANTCNMLSWSSICPHPQE
jgi:hypothetical protein